MKTKLEEIKEALGNVTQGEWWYFQPRIGGKQIENYQCINAGNGYFDGKTEKGFGISAYISSEDASFIAKAPEYIAYLLQLVEAANDEGVDTNGTVHP